MGKWIGRAVLLSFWMFSAWYLYVGGLLTKSLDFPDSVLAIVIANLIFVGIFTFYAGAGKPKDVLFREAFGKNGARYFISLLPTLTQIGWYAVVVEIGGSALALLVGAEKGSLFSWGIFLAYGLFTIWIAQGGLSRIGKLSYISVPAMLAFVAWGAVAVFNRLGFGNLLDYRPAESSGGALAAGIQILLASFISAAVTIPDFLHDLGSKKKVLLASLWGMVPTAVLVGGLGAAFAIIGKSYDVMATLQLISGPLIVYGLLSIDNLCGAQAVFPVGTGFASVVAGDCHSEANKEFIRKCWTLIGGLVSIALAIVGIVGHLATWLTILGVAFSPIIGVVLVNQYLLKNNSSARNVYWPALLSWAVGCAVAFAPWGIPVLNAMAASALCFALIGKTRR